MSAIEESVEVRVPVRTAYNQWTQFEDFPQFMEGVESIKQIDDTKTHWVTSIGGQKREFEAVITEQNPDERVAGVRWTARSRPESSPSTVSARTRQRSCFRWISSPRESLRRRATRSAS